MSIIFDEKEKTFTINTENTTYQMKIDKFGFLLHLYYGRKIYGSMDYLLTYMDRGFSGNPYVAQQDRTYSMDVLPQEYPTYGTGDYRNTALIIRNADGTFDLDLRFKSYSIEEGKYALKGFPAVYADETESETLRIVMEDKVSNVEVELLYGVIPKIDIITRAAVVRNNGEGSLNIKKAMSACLDFNPGRRDLITFYGRHCMERQMQREELAHGVHSIGSRRGTSSHQYNPSLIICDHDAREEHGYCWGMVFVYSGNFLAEAEKDQFNNTRALIGLQSDLFSYPLSKGDEFIIPETILTFSDNGFGGLSRNYHNCINNHIIRGKYKNKVRPVLINTWEAAYFDFTGKDIYEIAKAGSDLGIDMVVLDDGWFGARNDDNAGLGDWMVNEAKIGEPLEKLIGRIKKDLGLKFGIWIEPECLNENSDLYREHPEWVLKIPGRNPVRARNQLVLDYSRKEVVDHIYEKISRILDMGIDYVKWDMNTSITNVYSQTTGRSGRVLYDYVKGLYDLMGRFFDNYPDVLIEGCSGGGGRFDAGILYYSPQIWTSDNTDAIDRILIQYGTSFIYPISTMGAHVSAVPNHQTGREVSLKTRGVVAMEGTFGYELNPLKLSDEERNEIKEQVALFKEIAPLVGKGTYYRLSNPFEDGFGAWMFVSGDRKNAVVFAVMTTKHGNMTVNYINLHGLKKGEKYRDINTKVVYSAEALMNGGIPLPVEHGVYNSYIYRFEMAE